MLWAQCYKELLAKFSGSASLHHDYAVFCEAVLNDAETANKYRRDAAMLESGAPLLQGNGDAVRPFSQRGLVWRRTAAAASAAARQWRSANVGCTMVSRGLRGGVPLTCSRPAPLGRMPLSRGRSGREAAGPIAF